MTHLFCPIRKQRMSAELLPLLQNIIERLGGIESQLGISGGIALMLSQ